MASGILRASAESIEVLTLPNSIDAGPLAGDPGDARFRALVEHSLDVVNLFDADGRLIYTNPAMTRVLGWSAGELVGRPGIELIHPDDAEEAAALLARSLASPGTLFPIRLRMRHRDGSWRTVEGAGINLTHDPSVRALVSSLRDVTDRLRIERALRENEERYRTLFENAPVGIGLAAPDGALLEFNEAMMRPGGYARADIEAIGNVARLYADAADRDAVLEKLRREGAVRHHEVRFLRRDGSAYASLLSLTPVVIDGEPRVLAIVEDISARRALEASLAQSQKMEAVGQLAGGVAHDFNNLLTAIRGYADLCAGSLPAEHPAQDGVAQILAAADRAATVTRRLLAFARRERVEPRLIDVRTLIHGLEDLLRQMVGERVLLDIRLDDAPATVRIDPTLFEQVIVNLALNARDAMPAGGRLCIATRRPAAPAPADAGAAGEWVEIEVRDDGVGMSDEVQTRAFEPFFTTKGPDRGTGLGLSTCYGLVRQAGGHIDLQSVTGAGTSVRILLPLQPPAPVEPPARRTAGSATPPAAPRGAGETILLVEDEEGVRQFVRVALERLGYRVVEAADGLQGLAAARGHAGALDLVVADMVMPHMTGPQMAAVLHQEHPALPVLFMSGYADPTLSHAALEGSAVALLVKPFSLDALAVRVRAALDGR